MLSVRSDRSRAPSSLNTAQSEFDAAKFKPDGWHGAGGWPGATVWPRPVPRSRSLGDLRPNPQPNAIPPPPVSPQGSLDRPRSRPNR